MSNNIIYGILTLALLWGFFMDSHGSISRMKIFFILHQCMASWFLMVFPFYAAFTYSSFAVFVELICIEVVGVNIGRFLFYIIKSKVKK